MGSNKLTFEEWWEYFLTHLQVETERDLAELAWKASRENLRLPSEIPDNSGDFNQYRNGWNSCRDTFIEMNGLQEPTSSESASLPGEGE